MTIIQKPTPHSSARPVGAGISLLVLHADASKNEQATFDWLANPVSQVSYHYLVGREGTVYQFVPDERKAWHAGKSIFEGAHDCNRFSIGLSFSNDQKGEPFPDVQIDAGVALAVVLCCKHPIPIERITTHAVIRKAAREWAAEQGEPMPEVREDPGPLFPLAEFLSRVGAALP